MLYLRLKVKKKKSTKLKLTLCFDEEQRHEYVRGSGDTVARILKPRTEWS